MLRFTLFGLVLALISVSLLAEAPTAPAATGETVTITVQTPTATIAPMETEAPLRGVVTIVESNGKFYTNLGAKEQLGQGAELMVLRGQTLLSTAVVIRVNTLDSIASLPAEERAVHLLPGDTVVVKLNPNVTQNTNKIPWIEPKTSHTEQSIFFGLLTVLAIGYMVAQH